MKTLIKSCIVLPWMVAAGAVQAATDVYPCDNVGRVMYGDACTPAPKPAKLPPLSTMSPPSAGAAKMAKQFDTEAAHDAAVKQKADAAWLKHHEAEKAREETIRKGLVEHRVVKGMTPDQVRSILNQPDRIEDQGGPKERWIYNEAGHHHHTITFKDGVVAGDTERSSKHKK